MAITRAQQAKQMLQNGGRIGLRRGGVNEADVEAGLATQSMSDFSPSEGGTGTGAVDTGDLGSESANVAAVLNATKFQGDKPDNFFSKIAKAIPTPTNFIRNLLSKGDFRNRFVDTPNLKRRTSFLDSIGYGGQFTPEFIKSDLGLETLRNMGYTTVQDQINNQDDDDDSQPIIPLIPRIATNLAEEDESLKALGDRVAYRFMADGGRIGAQEGGIMPRLNQLGSGVSSAEQMLQGINQRLESAESSLGGGGEQMAPGFGTRPNLNVMIDPSVAKDLADQPQQAFQGGIPAPEPQRFSSYEEMMSQRMTKDVPAFFTDLEGVQRRPDGSLFEPKFGELPTTLSGNQFSQVTPPQTPVAMQTPISGIPAAGYANGGNVVGGEFDFESARQMYGLGKLVKKVTRGVKKIAKSPIGKAALLYAGTAGLGALGAKFGTGVSGSGFGLLKPANVLKNLAATKSLFLGIPGVDEFGGTAGLLKDLGLTKGGFGTIGGLTGKGILATIGTASLLPLLGIGTGDESEEEAQAILKDKGIDIADIRANPQKYQAMRFMAEGGSTEKEPVAKKTMPLLDMDGMEKDYRAEGGFVPIGRMEKADDVPARLSKNEFVFTADAVRNAGDGNVDKGAEVMYNMMKNLEAGGDVSEESQGLEGARKMFQTSQRLEEVL